MTQHRTTAAGARRALRVRHAFIASLLVLPLAIGSLLQAAKAPSPAVGSGAVSLTTIGTPSSQDFNTLGTSGTSSALPTGWYFNETGTNANGTYTAGSGTGNAGDTYSFGTGTNTDRAFGGLQSGSLVPTVGAQFVNNTGQTITSLAIGYTGEQWRLGALGRPDRLDFQYSLDATSLTTGTWTDVDTLDFISPIQAGTVGALDGNAAANRTALSSTIAVSVANGATFWIRWSDFNASGADDGEAVDDFSLTPGALPTPPTITTQPQSQSILSGQTATLTVAASGTPPLAYQWYEGTSPDTSNPVDTNSTSFTTPPLTSTTSYWVRVSNTSGVVNSNTATITVLTTPPNAVVISQVYGGGGNAGATYKNDYVELYNRSTAPVSVAGWSIQYASATGTGTFASNAIAPLSGSLNPGQYYLVALGSSGTVGADLPTPDATGTQNVATSDGKLILATSTTGLPCNGGTTPCGAAQLAQIVDLVGYGGADYFEGSGAAPSPSNTTAIFRAGNGATDTNNNASDFATGAPNPRNSSVTNSPPSITAHPQSQGIQSGQTATLSVTATGSAPLGYQWYQGTSGDTSNPIGGATASSYTTPPLTSTTSYWVRVTNAFGSADSNTATITIQAPPCSAADTPIGTVQGTGETSPLVGQTVTVQGVVVGDWEGASPKLRGFFVQDAGDGDPATSDGIFVFESDNANRVAVGAIVQVTGLAGENQGQTQISATTGVESCGSTGSVTPTDVAMPFPDATYLERFEGMLVRFPQTLYATEHFQLGRFGQVVMSSGGRLKQPTNVVLPGAPALALQAQNNLNRIIVDDDSQTQNPDPIQFGRGGLPLSASNTLRGADTVANLTGVLTYTWAGNAASGNAYRARPVGSLGGGVPIFQPSNARPIDPGTLGGTLRVAAGNLLNYFNTFGSGNCTNGVGGSVTDCRGAENLTEFNRQWPKTVAAILGGGADVVGVMELENDGYGPSSAIQDLVTKLNNATAPGTYAFIDADTNTGQLNALGTDAIKVSLLYKPASVTPVGQTAALNTVAFVNGGDGAPRNRPALAQAFQENATGARFIIVVNHLKSKGSACDVPDAGDGQGECNIVRTNAANLLTAWLAANPTGTGDPDILIVGDLNSYAKEDPITAIKGAGYTNLIETLIGVDGYSYAFDGQWGYLDHALGSSSLTQKVTGIAEYHINADEPSVLDYNTNFKSAGQLVSLYAADQYRMSDHDPAIVGLNLAMPIITTTTSVNPASGPYNGTATLSATVTGDGLPVVGVTVGFSLFGSPVGSAVTDGTGTATLPNVSLAGTNAGVYAGAITATFAGDTNYFGSSGQGALTVTKATQTITFGPLADKTYGDADFLLTATASSGLAVGYSASGVCTVTGSTVHITGVGSCTITASQPGDANYEPAEDVSRTFTVNFYCGGNFTIVPKVISATLTWTQQTAPAYYKLYRYLGQGTNTLLKIITVPAGTSWVDGSTLDQLTANTFYTWVLKPMTAAGVAIESCTLGPKTAKTTSR